MTALLTAENVTKRFGGLVAVNRLNFKLEQGTIASVIGPNGAGKTTFFNCIAGFYHADEGTIDFDGTKINTLRPDQIARLGVNRTYQNIRLFANMTAIENVLVGQHRHLRSPWIAAVLNLPGTRSEETMALDEARRLLRYVGLQGRGDVLAGKLPYGDQRRLEVGRALATKPRLLLLDEPTAGMNPIEKQQMTEFIRGLRDDLGITVLLIEHEMRVVMGISERITVLNYGEKLAEGTPHEIQTNPLVIEAYLGRSKESETPGGAGASAGKPASAEGPSSMAGAAGS